MKKLLLSAPLLAALLGAGLWFLVRRGPAAGPPVEAAVTFKTETSGLGVLVQYADGQTPLRALRWLPPLPGGVQAVQILTQSNRQGVVLCQDGKVAANLVIPRPAGVREGFFNFAELCEAAVVPGDVAVLLYRSADSTSAELTLVVAMDLPTQATRWVHRAPGDHLALYSGTGEGAAFLFGTSCPILRLPLALQKGERPGTSPFRPGLKAMDMPEEVKGAKDLMPTGSRSFLLAHDGGLSAYAEERGWKHWPAPQRPALAFTDVRPALARAKSYWWQPFPGTLVQVKPDGTAVASFDPASLAPAGPWSRDGALFRLRGADPAGNLWFTLAAPTAPSTVATPEPLKEGTDGTESDKGWKPENTPLPAAQDDWTTYCSQGLDRIYRWNPERRSLQGRSLSEVWAALAAPPGVGRPASLQDFRPESGKLLLGTGPSAWIVPLEALPLGTAGRN